MNTVLLPNRTAGGVITTRSKLRGLLDGKTVVVTGGTGSLGSQVVRTLLSCFQTREVRVFSRNEAMQQGFKDELKAEGGSRLKFQLGDVTKGRDVAKALAQADYLFHLAAQKRVDTCENDPVKALETNTLSADVIVQEAAKLGSLEGLVFMSSDKACDPTNTYGATKFLAERIVLSSPVASRTLVIRSGNFLGSAGSIVPRWIHEASRGRQLTVTDRSMTRFTATLEQGVELILWALANVEPPGIVTRTMASYNVGVLAEIISGHYGVDTRVVGAQAGEKLHEELLAVGELTRTRRVRFEHWLVPGGAGGPYDALVTGQQQVDVPCPHFTSDNKELLFSRLDLKELLSPELQAHPSLASKHAEPARVGAGTILLPAKGASLTPTLMPAGALG